MNKRLSLKDLNRKYQENTKLTALTAYDASMAALIDPLVDMILVGDSLGVVIQGHSTTLPVTTDEIIYHTRAVCRGSQRAFIIADAPFLSGSSEDLALRTAGRLLAEGGAQMVKFECGNRQVDLINRLSAEGIPVCAHIGFRPQSVHMLSNYFSQIKIDGPTPEIPSTETFEPWLKQANLLIEAGADLLLVECVPPAVAEYLSQNTDRAVIGIGSGNKCDGQILVLYDLLGISYGGIPPFVKRLDLTYVQLDKVIEAWTQRVRGTKSEWTTH